MHELKGPAVPCGLTGIRADLQTWFTVAGAEGTWDRVRVVLDSPALWAMALYRFGRWLRDPNVRRPRLVAKALWPVYRLLWPLSLWLTRVFLTVDSEVEGDVWIGSFDSTWIGSGARLERGVRIHGGVTLGLGGRGERRGVPHLGRDVTLAPGVVLVGKIHVADGAVVAANGSSAKSIEGSGGHLGAPLVPFSGAPLNLVPLPT